MNRPQAYFAFVLLAPLAAGLFGILHNQLSYTVAPEYFTQFKFIQFRMLESELLGGLLYGWLMTREHGRFSPSAAL